ncbi:MAG: hypothetical protein OXB88_05210 [Bacteriovoracales bacterium]|nr:hypothetical protein [Bacteriovoracales bacterium]
MKKEYDLKKMQEISNPYRGKIKKSVGINLSSEVIDYFKEMSAKTDIAYQKLIDMYLMDCVKQKRKLNLKWSA